MQGVPRRGAKTVWLTVNGKLLDEYDQIVPPKGRSRSIEAMMLATVLRHKFGEEVSDERLREMLTLID